jgi:predicted Zn-dependent protease
MSQVAQVPPPPIGPVAGDRHPLRYILFAAVLLLGLLFILELRFLNCSAGKEGAQRIREDPRIRAEFGDDVHIPFAVASGFGDEARIYAIVIGKRSYGYAVIDLLKLAESWKISGIDVHNRREGHLINLAKPATPAKPEQLKGSGTLYFLALGDAANRDVADLAGFFHDQFGIQANVLPAMSLPAEAYDPRRKQWIAEMLVEAMEAKYPDLEADSDAKLIGILEDDLYIYSFGWNYTYSYRWLDKYSVVPAIRLDPVFYRFPPDPSIRMERLQKIAMKAVGLLYLGFKESSDPQSVDSVEDTTEAIDRMGSVYLDSDAQTRRRLPKTDADGTPCLTFYSSILAGAPLRNPIVPCRQRNEQNEGSQFQIDLARGRFQLTRNDLYRGGAIPLALQRMDFSYHFDDKVRAFGKGTWQSLDDTVWSADPNAVQTINIFGTLFRRLTPGTGFSPTAKYRGEQNSSEFGSALLSWEDGGWRIDTRGGQIWRYLGCGPNTRVECYYMGHRTFRGDSIEVKRDPVTGHIQQVLQKTNPKLPAIAAMDHTWTPIYDGEKIAEIHDSDGRTAEYHYDAHEYLTDVVADGHRVHYDYDDGHRTTAVTEDGKTLRIHYDSEGRPDRVELPNRFLCSVKYSQDAITVDVPGARYVVTVMPTYFRVVEGAP